MILDTNALSAWAEGDRSIEPVLRSATEVVIPVIVLGEFDYGIRQSRHYRRYVDWLNASLDSVEIALIDRDVAHAYGAVRLELKQAGTPIPINDTWIAAIARHRRLPVVSRDGHFDTVSGLHRVSW
ncbi:MAG: type II toxin-antitoxin system VapC family toxin [Planctomycetia bacterium]